MIGVLARRAGVTVLPPLLANEPNLAFNGIATVPERFPTPVRLTRLVASIWPTRLLSPPTLRATKKDKSDLAPLAPDTVFPATIVLDRVSTPVASLPSLKIPPPPAPTASFAVNVQFRIFASPIK